MKVVKKTDEYTIVEKRNGRYGVKAASGWVNAEEKVKILLAEGLIKLSEPQEVPAEEPAEEAEASAEEAGEEAADEAGEEEAAE